MFPLLLLRGSFPSFQWFPYRNVLISTQLQTQGDPLVIRMSLSLQLSSLWYSVLLSLATVAFQGSKLCLLNSGRPLISTWVPPLCAAAWKHQAARWGNLRLPSSVSSLRIAVLHLLISTFKTHCFYILCTYLFLARG